MQLDQPRCLMGAVIFIGLLFLFFLFFNYFYYYNCYFLFCELEAFFCRKNLGQLAQITFRLKFQLQNSHRFPEKCRKEKVQDWLKKKSLKYHNLSGREITDDINIIRITGAMIGSKKKVINFHTISPLPISLNSGQSDLQGRRAKGLG